jgi:cytochrome P450
MQEINNTFKTINGGVHTFSINFLGSRAIYTMEPENVKAVFATNHKDYAIPQTRKDSLGIFGPGIFTSDGAHWEASRALLRPNFVRTQVGDIPALEKHVAALIGKIPRDGSAIDMVEMFSNLTMDAATELFLGESTHMLRGNQDPKAVRFNEAFGYCSERISIRIAVGRIGSLFPDPKYYAGVKDLKDFVDIYVSRALELRQKFLQTGKNQVEEGMESGRYVFLPELAKSGFDQPRIAAELMNILTAGRGSTTALLTVLWYTISRRSDIFGKLRQEVIETLGNRQPSFEELKSLRYLGWTLRESKFASYPSATSC